MGEEIDDTQSLDKKSGTMSMQSRSQDTELKIPSKPTKRKVK